MKSFVYAVSGLFYTIKTQRNMRVHLCFAFYVILFGLITGLSATEWVAVLICCGMVMGAECANTALESLCDKVCPERSKHIKAAKDAEAGAVLICALFSAAVGCVIFFGAGRPAAAFEYLTSDPWRIVGFAVVAMLWVKIIIGKRNGSKNDN